MPLGFRAIAFGAWPQAARQSRIVAYERQGAQCRAACVGQPGRVVR